MEVAIHQVNLKNETGVEEERGNPNTFVGLIS